MIGIGVGMKPPCCCCRLMFAMGATGAPAYDGEREEWSEQEHTRHRYMPQKSMRSEGAGPQARPLRTRSGSYTRRGGWDEKTHRRPRVRLWLALE
jgi:hypothetical protein